MASFIRKLNLTPRTTLLEKVGLGNFTVAEAVAELVANCFDARIYGVNGDEDIAEPLAIEIRVEENFISVTDNGKGMDADLLEAALTLAEDMDKVTGNTRSRMGLFGLGMKSASSSLGKTWTVTTKTSDAKRPITVTFHLAEFGAREDWVEDLYELDSKSPNPLGKRTHGTSITITNLRQESPSEGPILELLGSAYKPLLGHQAVITVNGEQVKPKPYNLVENSRVEIDIVIDEKKGWRITGWGGLDAKTNNDGRYGFQLFRKNQLIVPWNKDFFRQHLMTSRVVGEVNLDFVPTNYTKQGFQTESREWKAARAALREHLAPLAKASGDIASNKKDPMRFARATEGLQRAMGNAPRVDLPTGAGSIGLQGREPSTGDDAGDGPHTSGNSQPEPSGPESDKNSPVSIEAETIVIGEAVIRLAYSFEEWGDESILWDLIYDKESQELQAVINSGSKLFTSVKDSKFFGTLALADVVVRFLMSEFDFPLTRAIDIRDKWILASID